MHYVFGDYELDAQLYQLHRAGELVELEPKVFDLLVYLIEHHERVISTSDNTDLISLCCIRTTIVIKGSNTWEQKFQSTMSDSQHFVNDITFVSSRSSAPCSGKTFALTATLMSSLNSNRDKEWG